MFLGEELNPSNCVAFFLLAKVVKLTFAILFIYQENERNDADNEKRTLQILDHFLQLYGTACLFSFAGCKWCCIVIIIEALHSAAFEGFLEGFNKTFGGLISLVIDVFEKLFFHSCLNLKGGN